MGGEDRHFRRRVSDSGGKSPEEKNLPQGASAAALKQAGSPSAAFCSQTSAAFDFARFLVVFPATHFFLDTAPLYELAKATDRLLNRLAVPNSQLNHTCSFAAGPQLFRLPTAALERPERIDFTEPDSDKQFTPARAVVSSRIRIISH